MATVKKNSKIGCKKIIQYGVTMKKTIGIFAHVDAEEAYMGRIMSDIQKLRGSC